MLRVAVAMVVATALVAGCGGDDATQRDERTVIDEEDQQRAEDAVLLLSDFPSEWTATRAEDEDGDEGSQGCLEDIEYDLSDLTVTGDADSDDFESELAQVSSSVTIYESVEQATDALERVMAVLGGGELAGCLEELVEQGAEEEGDVDLDVGTVSGRDVPFPAVGEQTEAVELEVPFEVEGQSAAAYLAIVAIRQERAVGGIFMFSFPGPFPADEQERLAGVLADRLAP